MNDRTRVQSSLYLCELGYNSCNIHFFIMVTKVVHLLLEIAVNYDHIQYLKSRKDHTEWDSFSQSQGKGASISYYHTYHTADNNVKLPAQHNTESDQPNPPPDKDSIPHNRSERYANYKVGIIILVLMI